ncbi:beta barrel domain-containing protein [Mycobacteroides abscessus]|uniref:beta barrel domain-containing protein n=1 Tax=Mycobacteroides abscessus TaxID=36809 RepID=UPI00092675A9|nr:hypothetical protein [Mycobacteroides abscessus]SIL61346.1 Uncharacterised protein [Mycobacteroides abscessus subsp. abscessus]
MSEAKWHVGQTVFLSDGSRAPAEVPVTRVARKYVYITQYGRERKFNIDNGHEPTYTGHCPCIYTKDEWADREKRGSLLKALRDEGLYFSHGQGLRSTATLQRLWDALQVEEGKE